MAPGAAAAGAGDSRIPVGVLGATGTVGQRFITLLEFHPWFRVAAVTASERSAGRPYAEAVNWIQDRPIPAAVAGMTVAPTAPPLEPRILFSALDASVAGPVETAFARAGHVVLSNARNHRMDPDVPLLVPEVNPRHLDAIPEQGFPGGGAIVTNPNCSTIGLVLALAPLHRAFGVRTVSVTTLQAVSGAGLPGVSSYQIVDNVIPFIGGEEEKMESETRKILGDWDGGAFRDAGTVVSAQCNRVPVVDGHTECVSVALDRPASREEILEAWRDFRGEPQELGLPSAPVQPIRFTDAPDGPQPRRDRGAEGGMAVSVGRLRPCPVLDWKFVAVSHNTVRGAAGGALLCGELALAQGRIKDLSPPADPR